MLPLLLLLVVGRNKKLQGSQRKSGAGGVRAEGCAHRSAAAQTQPRLRGSRAGHPLLLPRSSAPRYFSSTSIHLRPLLLRVISLLFVFPARSTPAKHPPPFLRLHELSRATRTLRALILPSYDFFFIPFIRSFLIFLTRPWTSCFFSSLLSCPQPSIRRPSYKINSPGGLAAYRIKRGIRRPRSRTNNPMWQPRKSPILEPLRLLPLPFFLVFFSFVYSGIFLFVRVARTPW